MLYAQALSYLGSFINFEKIPVYPYKKSLSLKRLRDFLCLIGNPQEKIKFIHVAGSKGKGSTSAFIAYILKAAGYKTGLYTSPHLADVRERIRVLPGSKKTEFEGMITRAAFKRLVERLKPEIEKYNRRSCLGPLTFFEFLTILALVYFRESKVDFAVLETGLGGRLDATNVVRALVSVITPISYEHTDKLGKTLSRIAFEKAGIIKSKRAPVVSAPQEKEAREVIRARCRAFKSRLYAVNRYKKLNLKLLGRHQLINAAVAAKAVEALSAYGIKIRADSIRRGLYDTVHPGRCEVIRRNPYLVLDGAQNAASAKALKDAIRGNFKYGKLILILGVSRDKDLKGICAELYGLADEVILTKSANPRAAEPEILAGYFRGKNTYIAEGVAQAKRLSRRLAGEKDLVLVTGSLFLVGEFKYGKRNFN